MSGVFIRRSSEIGNRRVQIWCILQQNYQRKTSILGTINHPPANRRAMSWPHQHDSAEYSTPSRIMMSLLSTTGFQAPLARTFFSIVNLESKIILTSTERLQRVKCLAYTRDRVNKKRIAGLTPSFRFGIESQIIRFERRLHRTDRQLNEIIFFEGCAHRFVGLCSQNWQISLALNLTLHSHRNTVEREILSAFKCFISRRQLCTLDKN